MNYATPKQQQGMTLVSLISLLGLIAITVLLTLKIGPIYMNQAKVSDVLHDLEKTDGVANMSEYQLRDRLRKQFNIGYISDVRADDVAITKSGGYLKVWLEYETVEPIVGNLSVLVQFSDGFEIGG